MDEAHNFLADAEGAQAQQVIATFTEAAKQGRKERLGLFLITQDPKDIAPGIFKQVNTRCVLNLVDRAAIDRVNVPAALRWAVPYLGRGEMIVHSPDNSEAVQVTGLPVALTRHGR
jgi:DNA helicase HerA-like ATPase